MYKLKCIRDVAGAENPESEQPRLGSKRVKRKVETQRYMLEDGGIPLILSVVIICTMPACEGPPSRLVTN